MNKIIVSVPGKLMIMGEHAVVYGKPCIVMAINPRIKVTAEFIDNPQFELYASDVGIEKYQKPMNGIGIGEIPQEAKFTETALSNFLTKYKTGKGIKITTKADFLPEQGLGSSAATVVGVITALVNLFGAKLTQKEIFDLSYKTVIDIQKVGSGFDIAAAIYGGTLYFTSAGKMIEPLKAEGLDLIVGYSGVKADTASIVNSINKKMKTYKVGIEKIFSNIESLVNEAKNAILEKDWERLGILMNYNQNYLEDLGVSTDKLNQMIEKAQKAGAFGAKLSGAGGGDCMIALVSTEKRNAVCEAIKTVGGKIIDISINAEGAKSEENS